jgi:hypothetical protein
MVLAPEDAAGARHLGESILGAGFSSPQDASLTWNVDEKTTC